MYILYIKFQFTKRKGKEGKLPDILSNKEKKILSTWWKEMTVQGLKQLKTGQLRIYLCQF